jgi:hypothetical protein
MNENNIVYPTSLPSNDSDSDDNENMNQNKNDECLILSNEIKESFKKYNAQQTKEIELFKSINTPPAENNLQLIQWNPKNFNFQMINSTTNENDDDNESENNENNNLLRNNSSSEMMEDIEEANTYYVEEPSDPRRSLKR